MTVWDLLSIELGTTKRFPLKEQYLSGWDGIDKVLMVARVNDKHSSTTAGSWAQINHRRPKLIT